jgi:hypothetical protein
LETICGENAKGVRERVRAPEAAPRGRLAGHWGPSGDRGSEPLFVLLCKLFVFGLVKEEIAAVLHRCHLLREMVKRRG